MVSPRRIRKPNPNPNPVPCQCCPGGAGRGHHYGDDLECDNAGCTRGWFQERGEPTRCQGIAEPSDLDQRRERVTSLRLCGWSIADIARELGVSLDAIQCDLGKHDKRAEQARYRAPVAHETPKGAL